MDLKSRVLEGELMDAPDLEARQHRQALKGLERVNRLSGTAHVIARAIIEHFAPTCAAGGAKSHATLTNVSPSAIPSRPLRILDLACGGGDVTLAVAQNLIAAGLNVAVEGWDRSPTAIEFANRRSAQLWNSRSDGATAPVRFHEHDVQDLDGDREFDVVMCTLFLHHLTRDEAVQCLQKMVAAARELVLVDDLRRTWLGYRLAQLGCQILSRSPIVHVDGPLSVRAAFTERELESLSRDAGLPPPRFQLHWPQRFLMRWDLSS